MFAGRDNREAAMAEAVAAGDGAGVQVAKGMPGGRLWVRGTSVLRYSDCRMCPLLHQPSKPRAVVVKVVSRNWSGLLR